MRLVFNVPDSLKERRWSLCVLVPCTAQESSDGGERERERERERTYKEDAKDTIYEEILVVVF